MSESEFSRRIRDQLSASFDWDVEARAKAWARPKPKRKPSVDRLAELPIDRAPPPVGAVGRLVPTPFEMAILRRAARGFIMLTLINGEAHFTYEDGTIVRDERTNKPLDKKGWARLSRFLVAEKNDNLFDLGPAQRWNVRQVPT